MNTPILFLIVRRPDTTRKVFDQIKKAKPKELFIASDGARIGNDFEKALNEECKNFVLNNIDWECEVKTLFQTENLGCGLGIKTAIDWFFEHVDQGIILEDDCLPDLSFFNYCDILLNRYKDNNKIMSISGDNFQNGIQRGKGTYYFSNIFHSWGWATWKRAWKLNDFSIKEWPTYSSSKLLEKCHNNQSCFEYWSLIFEGLYDKTLKVDTWDYQFLFSIWFNDGFNIHPNLNLISNIGFGENSTHLSDSDHKLANLFTQSYSNDVIPKRIQINKDADNYTFYNVFTSSISLKRNFFSRIYNLLKGVSLKIIRDKFYLFRKTKINHLKDLFKVVFYYKNLSVNYKSKKRTDSLAEIERYKDCSTIFQGKTINYIDYASYQSTLNELFIQKIYSFKSKNESPIIIDCGANIGLSILFFKELYPEAKVLAFEADPKVFSCLKKNIDGFNFDDVEIINKALWNTKTTLSFYSEGADAGRLDENISQDKHIINVETICLSEYLHQQIDLLKIDIEGAEYQVLLESKDLLSNVDNLFVEYHSFIDKPQHLNEILEILTNAGFRYYVSSIGIKSTHPFINRNQYLGMDNQLNIFGYR